jgi:tyrosyl-tRNA synthetase
MNFIEELKWRGLIQDITPGTEEYLAENLVTAYIGFDPTADSLHIGNMVPIMLLTFFQRHGHKPIALVGGATGMIGDPSGKKSERQFLSEDVLRHNQEAIKAQLSQFLDFSKSENAAEIVNNYDWFKDISLLDFLRNTGKHLTVNYMMSKDSVKSRLETGISYTEFTYQLIQGYDFLHLLREKNVRLQMGGSDQWGNITAGTELIRRTGAGDAFALTAPLITKADGSKFGKSEGGNVWLDKNRTSPYKFYQYWLNAADEDVEKWIKIFSLKTKDEIESLIAEHADTPHMRILQKALAEELTQRVHGEQELQNAIEASQILFGKSTEESLRKLDSDTLLSVFEGVPQFEVSEAVIKNGVSIVDLAAEHTEIFASKGEARRMIKSNAVSVNKSKVGEDYEVSSRDLLNASYILIQKGKKNYFLVRVV